MKLIKDNPMNISTEKTIGEVVAQDYRTASVFEKFGIDFCCKGNVSIAEACEKRNIGVSVLLEDLNKVILQNNNGGIDFNSWPLDLLSDYVEKTHHKYVDKQIPVLQQYLDKICQVHGKVHPELFEIKTLFNQTAGELTAHMKKEEFILFPFIRRMANAIKEKIPMGSPPFGTVQNPVNMMMHEHDAEGERFRKIAGLSHNYNPPNDACNTYKVTYALLKEFEKDLHLHIHLENNILFPKAIAMEQKLH